MAAGVAYYAILSIFPFTLGLIAFLGYFLPAAQLEKEMLSFLNNALPFSTNIIERNVNNIIQFRHAIGLVSIALILWTITGVYGAVNKAINQVWSVRSGRNYLVQKLSDLLIAVITGILLIVSMEANALFPVLRSFRIVEASTLINYGGKLLSVLMMSVVFLLIYKFVPNRRINWNYVWPGVLFGVILFEVARNLFIVYLTNFANYEMIYGSISSVIIFLVWIYYSAIILIFGAEINSEYARMSSGSV